MAEFRVLGSFEVRSAAGEAIAMPSRRQRALLARLLLSPSHTVSADSLIESAWTDGAPPRHPVPALQTLVSRLRVLLEDTGAELETAPPGYRLRVPPEMVDSWRFEDLVGEARVLAAVGDPAAAVARYDEAAALWRGAAYAEFADAFAGPEAVRLEQIRLAAAEERLAALLEAGDTATAVADAETLTRAEPLRERAQALLMRALARSGRATDALAVYQRVRERLADELGTEPSDELKETELLVLRNQVGPSPCHAPGGSADRRRHAAVPHMASGFVGRAHELAEVAAALSRDRLVTVTGPGGVGKTRLAIECAARWDGASPAWVELALADDAESVVSAFLDALGVPDPWSGTWPEALTAALRDHEAVILVDNCENVIDHAAAVISRILRACPRVRVLATSRERLAVEGEAVFDLAPLPADGTATDLFLARLSAADRTIDITDAEVRRLAGAVSRRLDGLPLALELAAPRAAALGLAEMLESADLFGLVAGRRGDPPRHTDLSSLLAWSYELLTEDEQRLLRRLSVFPGAFGADWAERVCSDGALPAPRVAGLLAALTDKSLVTRLRCPRTGRRGQTLLETVRHFARRELETADEPLALRAAHASFLVSWTAERTGLIGSAYDGASMYFLHAAANDFRAAFAWTHRHDPDLGIRLSAALHRYAFNLRGDHELLQWSERALGLPGFHVHPQRSAVLASAAAFAGMRGDHETALRRAREAVFSLGPGDRQAPAVHDLSAWTHWLAGDPAHAMAAHRRQWREARALDDLFHEGLAASRLAVGSMLLGDRAEAERWLVRCRSAAGSARSPVLDAYAENAASHCRAEESPEAAVEHLARCHELASALGFDVTTGHPLVDRIRPEAQASGT
ncbi:ATP-binding protein [Thermomonospora echinospora]|nr:BTAD domain-containing putative transcriptional regulator [Thermomonospora echinospora]